MTVQPEIVLPALDPVLESEIIAVDTDAVQMPVDGVDVVVEVGVEALADDVPSPTVFAVDQVATRQAGYTVSDYVVVEGVPVGYSPSARTSVVVKGYSAVPTEGPQTAVEATHLAARWIPTEDTWNGLSLAPVAGNEPFSLDALSGQEPALLDSLFAYTVRGRWFSSAGLDFTGSDRLTGVGGYSSDSVGFVAAVVLRRPVGQRYAVVDFTGQSRLRLVYDASEDQLVMMRDDNVLAYTDHLVSTTDLVVVGLHADGYAGTRMALGQSGSRTQIISRRIIDTDFTPASSLTITVGDSADGLAPAQMVLVDAAVVLGSAADFDDVVTDYASGYLTASARED